MQVVYQINPRGGILRFNSLLFEMLYLLYHNFAREVESSSVKKDVKNFKRLDPVLIYTKEHYNDDRSPSQRLQKLPVFRKNISVIFSKKIWESPTFNT